MLLLLLSCALCEGGDITSSASFSGRKHDPFSHMTDGDYRTRWKAGKKEKNYLEVTLPDATPCGTLWIRWYGDAVPFTVMYEREGAWLPLCRTADAFLSAAVRLPFPESRLRICPAEEDAGPLSIAEIRLYAPGEVPAEVQFWRPAPEKADLMLVSCHPDDEVLWFGGALPTYAGQRQKDVVVCLLVPASARRQLEFLDSLWTCGVRTYPVLGGMPDQYSTSLKDQYSMWSKNRLEKMFARWYRRYRPDVVLTHDIRGEYGHGGHRVCADMCIRALETAADERFDPESAARWGVWDVPKLYLHLYGENPIVLPWDSSLDFFGGRSGLEVAREAFACHISQQNTHYAVNSEGRYDCTRFGLYRSLVGDDTEKNDLFEHLDPYYNPFEVIDD